MRFAAEGPFFDVSNFSHKSTIRTALHVKLTPPFGCWCKHPIYQRDEGEKGSKVMLTPKNPQKALPAAIAHMNDLLDEALKETFPASDPIAINIDPESPEHGIAITPGFRAPLRGTRKTP